jgi:hypothetical protein
VGLCSVAHALTLPLLPLRSATASEQQSLREFNHTRLVNMGTGVAGQTSVFVFGFGGSRECRQIDRCGGVQLPRVARGEELGQRADGDEGLCEVC